jgi:hypothetical protein
MPFKFDRSFYIPAHSVRVASKRSTAVAYLSTEGRPVAVCFVGKANKPAAHYSFRDDARRAKFVAEWIAQQDAAEAARVERKAKRVAFVHTLKVGDLLETSWGYDQTNVEFFEVVALVGRSMVEVREVAQRVRETGFMSGTCGPVAGEYVGAPMRKRVLEGNTLDIHGGFGYARPCERITIAPGVQITRPAHWSNYA